MREDVKTEQKKEAEIEQVYARKSFTLDRETARYLKDEGEKLGLSQSQLLRLIIRKHRECPEDCRRALLVQQPEQDRRRSDRK
jgi:hypothetical protein